MKKRLLNILFWSVLSAAFIGPGTVTTAASAGAGFGYTLAWALVFSTIACYVLQEASARITATTGNNLGESIRKLYIDSPSGKFLVGLTLVSILSGCAAYEAGNILGAVSGLELITGIPTAWTVLSIGAGAALILWLGSIERIAQLLGVIVAVMGLCFLGTALVMDMDIPELSVSMVTPRIPDGAEVLVLGLIGTTVVPYNIFLGSGLKHSQTPREMKLSMGIAIGLGGLISIAVLLVGTSIAGSFTFEGLAEALADQLGGWAASFFGIGLFAAGVSSTLTAALASSITAQSILAHPGNSHRWKADGDYFRSVWVVVLLIGLFFGLIRVQPVPAIILAQALNGIILPVIAVLLLLLVNNSNLLPVTFLNSVRYNFLMGIVVFITILIGITNVTKALSPLLGIELVDQRIILGGTVVCSLLLIWPAIRKIRKKRYDNPDT